MHEGLYKAEFQTPFGSGISVFYLYDGKVRGGNSGLYYVGEYRLQDNHFQATLVARRHSRNLNVASVFGVETAHVTLEGNIEGETLLIEGFAEEVPDMNLTGKLTYLSD